MSDIQDNATAMQADQSFQSVDESARDGDLLQLVTFVVGNEEYGISILAVQEINRMMSITRVPHSPEFIVGVVNLRGRIIPVMDLRQRFGRDAKTDSEDARIIVVEVSGRMVGFTVDRVNEVLRIDSSIVDSPPAMVAGAGSEYVSGVGKLDDRLLILLDLEKLLSDLDLSQFDRAAEGATTESSAA